MNAVDKKYFNKYAIDPFEEDFMLDAYVEGWVDTFDGEALESNGFYEDEWDELV
jgi:hypothetical protein